ncbi:MAG TPA: FAD-dependent oxidoreductase [Steroidobacteraceae bacterium]
MRDSDDATTSRSSGAWDVVIIGGGIAGLSLAAELSTDRRVAVLEKEPSLAAHTTGRSVATFIQSYGNAAIQQLNADSLPFFQSAVSEAGVPFAKPLPFLYAASSSTVGLLDTIYDAARAHSREMRFLDGNLAVKFCPILRPGWVVRGLVDPTVLDIDVHALMQHHAAALRSRGGMIATGVEIVSACHAGHTWVATDAHGNDYSAPVLVNAANAWADAVASRCGARPLGVTPLKRSVFTLAVPENVAAQSVPMVNAADEEFYFKPDAGQLLCSPADETATGADVQGAERPDELEIARALDGLARATVLDTRHVRTTWAGLRCFAADRTPLVGWDASVEGFFWYTALGGYGIQTSPALSRVGAELVRGGAAGEGVIPETAAALDPAREMHAVGRHESHPPAGHA